MKRIEKKIKTANMNMKHIRFVLISLSCILSINLLQAQQLAFPTAEGFGRYASGGRGGDVYHVINLNDAGAGSFREGIASAIGPRTIVFDVSGNIDLASRLKIDKPNITVAGQTAPGDGICLRDYSFTIDADNIIVRYIRSRLGDNFGQESDAISIDGGSDIIVDHCTASWSVDECFSAQADDCYNLTIQWSMITEALNNSIHKKGAHSYGQIIGSRNASIHHNIYSNLVSRSPKISWRQHGEVDVRNNVMYNWEGTGQYDGSSCHINWVNNYYKPGNATKTPNRLFKLNDVDSSSGGDGTDWLVYETQFYCTGNYVVGYPFATADNWSAIGYSNNATEALNRVDTPFPWPALPSETTALDCYSPVLAGAGASLVRDSVDTRIVNEIITGTTSYGTNGIIDDEADVGAWPTLISLPAPTDTDQDGMPDAWETASGLNFNEASDRNGDDNSNGYTNLEEYLNGLVKASPQRFVIEVNSGLGGGMYMEDNNVSLSADAPLSGKKFLKWIGDTIHVADVNEENTTVTMPADDVSLTATYEDIISVNRLNKEEAFLIYPNPANSGFSINLKNIGNSNIDIYNLFGKLVYNAVSTKSNHFINDHNLSAGIYFIKVKDNSQNIYTQQLLIK